MAINHILGAVAMDKYMNFLVTYFSNDGVISCQECVLGNVDKLILFLGLLWIVLYIISERFNARDFDILHFQKIPFEIKIVWLSFSALTASWFFFKFLNIYPALYMEDHLLENMTAIFFFAASILLIVKFFHPGMYYRWWLLFVAALFFFIAMEEISWGQRIIGWSTPETFSEFNYQNETNLHNILNPVMTPLYVIANFLIGIFLLYIKEVRLFLFRFPWKDKILPVLPTSVYADSGFIFLFLSLQRFWFGDELTEQFVSVYILVYTLEIYLDAFYAQLSVKTEGILR